MAHARLELPKIHQAASHIGYAVRGIVICGLMGGIGFAQTQGTAAAKKGNSLPPQQVDRPTYEKSIGAAIGFLRRSQQPDGSYSPADAEPAVTALVTTGLMRHGISEKDPVVARGLAYVRQFVQPDGGIYREGSFYRNYETCLAILCLSQVKDDPEVEVVVNKAKQFLEELQWDEGEGEDVSSPAYGGGGYGRNKRPDLSNTSFLIDALRAAGAGEDDEAIQRALVFVSRCQNLESEHNTLPFPAKNPDGGFYYTPAAGGNSQAGETPEGGLRSYASMTYAGLKSMLYAGVKRDDPRVQAAVTWIRQHFDLEQNPGMEKAGLFYYYHTFAKALDAVGDAEFQDAQGVSHAWKAELVAKLASLQRSDGAWVNDNSRWMEGDPHLVTGYALLSLSYCKPAAK